MEKIREDFDYIKQALDDMLYYNQEELERQADEYEREMARKEGLEQGLKEGCKEGLEQGLKEGREEGLEQGLKEGVENRNKEIVLRLLENKYSISEIKNITALSEEKINKIIKEQKSL